MTGVHFYLWYRIKYNVYFFLQLISYEHVSYRVEHLYQNVHLFNFIKKTFIICFLTVKSIRYNIKYYCRNISFIWYTCTLRLTEDIAWTGVEKSKMLLVNAKFERWFWWNPKRATMFVSYHSYPKIHVYSDMHWIWHNDTFDTVIHEGTKLKNFSVKYTMLMVLSSMFCVICTDKATIM